MGSLVGGVVGTIGGILGGNSAAKAARAQAESLRQAGQQAFEASRFRPVGITTRFGSSQFEVDPTTGALTSAGYTAAPEVAALQDRLFSQMGQQGINTAEQAMAAQQGLFNLGQQYLAESPEAAAQSWMQRQQAALAPARERALNQVRQGLFSKGRSGLAIGQGEGMQAANPEMAAYYNALAQQDLNLAAQAQEQGQQQARFGAGLLGTGLDLATAGYRPLATQFDIAKALEAAAQQPLTLGQTLGQTASQINSNAAQLRLNPQTQAAGVQAKADAWNPWAAAFQGLGNTFGSMSMPTGGSGTLFGMGGSVSTPLTYGTNFGSQQSSMLAEQDKWLR